MATDPDPPTVFDIWTRQRPGSRRPRLSQDRIAEAAIGIADREGVDALSMRRLASELDVGTMTLYHYVRTKDELLALVMDRVIGELVVPAGEFPESWREAMTAIAVRTRDVLLRHPWVFDIAEDPTAGPNAARHMDQSLAALASLRVSLEEQLDILHVVDEYVFGYCLHARSEFHRAEDSPAAQAIHDYLTQLTGSGDYEHIGRLIEQQGADALWGRMLRHNADPDRFERNLAHILDGIERHLQTAGGAEGRR